MSKRVNKFENKKGKNQRVSNQTVLGTQDYLNKETGEIEKFSVIDKKIDQDVNFHKIWLQDVLNVLDSFGNKKILVITYLLKSMRNEDNTFSGSYREIAVKCDVSLPTVSLVMNELLDSDIIRKISTATYQFNPSLIVKGSSSKRRNLLIRYNYAEDDEKQVNNAKIIPISAKEAFGTASDSEEESFVNDNQVTMFDEIDDVVKCSHKNYVMQGEDKEIFFCKDCKIVRNISSF